MKALSLTVILPVQTPLLHLISPAAPPGPPLQSPPEFNILCLLSGPPLLELLLEFFSISMAPLHKPLPIKRKDLNPQATKTRCSRDPTARHPRVHTLQQKQICLKFSLSVPPPRTSLLLRLLSLRPATLLCRVTLLCLGVDGQTPSRRPGSWQGGDCCQCILQPQTQHRCRGFPGHYGRKVRLPLRSWTLRQPHQLTRRL
mmetsp:Transcript_25874/g.35699  ORF Transcript_25874/g.35699 Transcript_25874/m.35699 type:complete len:200 (-) Transcript_25874:21-620(-)